MEFKAYHRGKKGTLSFGDNDLRFTRKGKDEPMVVISYGDIAGVNKSHPVFIFLRILFLPVTLLYWLLILILDFTDKKDMGSRPTPSAKVKITTTDGKKFKFNVPKNYKSVVAGLRKKIK